MSETEPKETRSSARWKIAVLREAPFSGELSDRLRWFIFLRWGAILGTLLGAVFAPLIFPGGRIAAGSVAATGAILAVLNVFYTIWERRSRFASEYRTAKETADQNRKFALFQIMADFSVLTILIHFSGGIQNPIAFFYVFHVIISAILLPPSPALLTTTWAAFLYVGLILMEHFGLLAEHPLAPETDFGRRDSRLLAIYLGGFVVTLFLASYMTLSIAMHLRKREDEILRLNDELAEAEHAKSRFLSLVSHELRSPLAAMRTWLESILVSQDDLTPESRRALERCSIRSQGLLTLTKELLELSKQRDVSQTAKRFKPTDLRAVVEGVAELHEAEARKKNLTFVRNLPETPCWVSGDADALTLAATNLTSNAVRYTPENGTVEIALVRENDRWRLSVKDTGIGIATEDVAKIGTDFFRTLQARKFSSLGTGLGMAITFAAIKSHKGEIRIESELGQGTTFHAYLPVLTPTLEGGRA